MNQHLLKYWLSAFFNMFLRNKVSILCYQHLSGFVNLLTEN